MALTVWESSLLEIADPTGKILRTSPVKGTI